MLVCCLYIYIYHIIFLFCFTIFDRQYPLSPIYPVCLRSCFLVFDHLSKTAAKFLDWMQNGLSMGITKQKGLLKSYLGNCRTRNEIFRLVLFARASPWFTKKSGKSITGIRQNLRTPKNPSPQFKVEVGERVSLNFGGRYAISTLNWGGGVALKFLRMPVL